MCVWRRIGNRIKGGIGIAGSHEGKHYNSVCIRGIKSGKGVRTTSPEVGPRKETWSLNRDGSCSERTRTVLCLNETYLLSYVSFLHDDTVPTPDGNAIGYERSDILTAEETEGEPEPIDGQCEGGKTTSKNMGSMHPRPLDSHCYTENHEFNMCTST